jgi:predicted Zn-dependent protease
MRCTATLLLVLFVSMPTTAQPPAVAALERAVAANPADVRGRQRLADAYLGAGRPMDAAAELRKATTLSPRVPSLWYALGQAYNAVKQQALATFGDPSEGPWRQLLSADALLANNHLTDAFAVYQGALESLPSMVSIHDSIAHIYKRTGHHAWAVRERAKGPLTGEVCAARKALCEFSAGRYRPALAAAFAGSDSESRYWRARAANELALAAFRQLDALPDSVERRGVRATVAQAEERYTDAVAELKAALRFAPQEPGLIYELASAYYSARDFESAITTSAPLLQAHPDDARLLTLKGHALLQLRRPEEAIPILQHVVERDPANAGARLALGRAHLQNGNAAMAIALIEGELARDDDGSLHVQLARAYTGLGQREKAAQLLARSDEIQRAARERAAVAAQRTITPPK